MKQSLIIILFIFSYSFIYSQNLYPLTHYSLGKDIPFDFEGVDMYSSGNLYTLESPPEIQVSGGGGNVKVDSLIIYNKEFNSAIIQLNLSRCVTSEYMEQEAGAFFVSIAFFDVDSNFVIGHSMISDYGFSLAGAAYDLQATKLIASKTNNCYTLVGKDEIAIHQAFLYKPDSINGGILPIHFAMIKILHLGAG